MPDTKRPAQEALRHLQRTQCSAGGAGVKDENSPMEKFAGLLFSMRAFGLYGSKLQISILLEIQWH